MQKIQGTENTIEIFENDIDLYLHQFQEEQEIEDMRNISQSVWNGCLMYIRRYVFPNTDILKAHNNITNDNSIMDSNYNSYDYDLIDSICNYYIYICTVYDKEISIIGFSNLTGINNSVIQEWGANYSNSNRLSSKSLEIYKKLIMFREESLANKLVTGKQNPIGIIAALRRHYSGWDDKTIVQHESSKGMSARTPEQIAAEYGQNVPQIAQKPLELPDA